MRKEAVEYKETDLSSYRFKFNQLVWYKKDDDEAYGEIYELFRTADGEQFFSIKSPFEEKGYFFLKRIPSKYLFEKL